jgi:hypothetical protein
MPAILDIRGLPATLKMLDEFNDRELSNKMRRAVRAGIAPFRTEMRAVAAEPQYPRSFRKTKSRTSTRGGVSGRDIEAYVRPSSPLFNIFEPGAGQHEIAPKGSRSGGVLAGPAGGTSWDPGGRKRPNDFFARGAVSHPGMAARPLLARVFAAADPTAEDAVAVAIFGPATGPVVGE